MNKELPYNPDSPESIRKYGLRLEGKCISEFMDKSHRVSSSRKNSFDNKGQFGLILETAYFKINPGNESVPDFANAKVELKSSPLIIQNGNTRVKERLVLGLINYFNLVKETWTASHFLKKNGLLLIVFYFYDKDASPLHLKVDLVDLWSIPEKDIEMIKKDWSLIKQKTEEGKAHLISGRDTKYLEACTKASNSTIRRAQPFSDEQAKPRAYALKRYYIDSIYHELKDKRKKKARNISSIIKDPSELVSGRSFEEIVKSKFEPYRGKSFCDILKLFNIKYNPKNKACYDKVTRTILGIKGKKIEEFEKANIILRTVRLKYNGVPAEAVSFSAFDYNEIIQEEWETSTLKTEYLDKKICFVIYQYTTMDKEDSKLYLKDVLFWALPFKHIDAAKSTWEETIKRIKMGRSDKLPTAKETKVIHVRPHAQKKKDACKTPTGGMETKKSFWINAKYLAKEFEKILSSFKHDKTLERLNQ